MSKHDETISFLVNRLKEGDLAAFVGSGASLTYVDPRTQKRHPGLLSASGMVKAIANRFPQIDPDASFEKAFFQLRHNYGRATVERTLQQMINIPTIRPLPAHEYLAKLPFSAYFTTNFDELLERALLEVGKSNTKIIENNDVPLIRASTVPIVKLHGCISRPETLIACEDEYLPLDASKGKNTIISSLVISLLSNRTLLFIGYGLQDYDFKTTFASLKAVLGDYMPRSYAVVHGDKDDYDKVYWESQGITFIEYDLTDFLRVLFSESCKSVNSEGILPSGAKDDWIKNSFFSSILEMRSAPSETQAIEAFLSHLLQEEESSNLGCREIIGDANAAIESVLRAKPNFHAFAKLWDDLKVKLEEVAAQDHDHAQSIEILKKLNSERHAIALSINSNSAKIIQSNSNILVFSQSIRMMDFLKSVPHRIQATCSIFICECRPKSPAPFQDARAICEYLQDSCYKSLCVIPDMAAGNLIQRKQINCIIMGAHSLHYRNGKCESFVNTCGTEMICCVAKKYSIPVYIVAEKSKNLYLSDNDSGQRVTYEEEENIFLPPFSSEFDYRVSKIDSMNIGYDLCYIDENISIISDS